VVNPLVSVIMPVLNAEKYLKNSIESILNQSYTNFEFIILDDASTDNSREIISSYSDKRIRFFFFQERKGLNYLLNTGIEKAFGLYLARMDADDESLEKRLEHQIKLLESEPGIDICSCWMETFTDKVSTGLAKGYSENEFLKLELLYRPGFAHPTVVYRKSVFENGVQYRVPYADDYDVWTQLVHKHKFYKIKKKLFRYRIHQKQFTAEFKPAIKKSIIEVQRGFHKSINLHLPINYEALHHDITFYQYKYTYMYALRLFAYFRFLKSLLKRNSFFDSFYTSRYIDDQLYSICSEMMKNGVNVYRLYLKEVVNLDLKKALTITAKFIMYIRLKSFDLSKKLK